MSQFCADYGLPRHVGDQVFNWVYANGVVDPAAMTNLAKNTRTLLAEEMVFYRGGELGRADATDGTVKLLIGWDAARRRDDAEGLPVLQPRDGDRSTETVMIPTQARRTACVSSQVGCPVGCRFCASGLDGVEGNLDAGQIVEQAHRLSWMSGGDRITNIVFMGMGEPLANADQVMRAIRTLNAAWGMGIGARRITVSTVGLPAAIEKFSTFDIPVTLALSLHAPTDDLRRELIPWAEYSTVDDLLGACEGYFRSTGREITIEYLLLHEVNDRVHHARTLATLCRRMRANVNLIRYNEVPGLPYTRPQDGVVRAFQQTLRDAGVNTHIRASRGRDIAAACGQLKREVMGR
ncbi:MAG: 23S rRNA (adenine(2503)-C(2))-methyltransferase RlmN [Phycisphaerales bacterium]|nr:23S rRNA (adenine(2503)-C(2))-methyltransferase RlmN [Phycisphaerales bacterium]